MVVAYYEILRGIREKQNFSQDSRYRGSGLNMGPHEYSGFGVKCQRKGYEQQKI
jgi:hypothetical protein